MSSSPPRASLQLIGCVHPTDDARETSPGGSKEGGCHGDCSCIAISPLPSRSRPAPSGARPSARPSERGPRRIAQPTNLGPSLRPAGTCAASAPRPSPQVPTVAHAPVLTTRGTSYSHNHVQASPTTSRLSLEAGPDLNGICFHSAINAVYAIMVTSVSVVSPVTPTFLTVIPRTRMVD